ncbi:hypothetical protein D3C76_1586020 [compost metagenome]
MGLRGWLLSSDLRDSYPQVLASLCMCHFVGCGFTNRVGQASINFPEHPAVMAEVLVHLDQVQAVVAGYPAVGVVGSVFCGHGDTSRVYLAKRRAICIEELRRR